MVLIHSIITISHIIRKERISPLAKEVRGSCTEELTLPKSQDVIRMGAESPVRYSTLPVDTQATTVRPEFIRLPKSGTLCPFTGLSRSTLNGAILPNAANQYNPPVRSVCLRQRGGVRGIRLIDYESLITWIRGQQNQTHGQMPKSSICQMNLSPSAREAVTGVKHTK